MNEPFNLRREVDRIEARYRDDRPTHPYNDDEGLDGFMDLPLVAFFRRWQFGIGVCCYLIAVATGMYFAFQLGRGVL